mgnify:CR=1 FL=1
MGCMLVTGVQTWGIPIFDGIAGGLIAREMQDEMAINVLILAMGISEWP